MPRVVSIPRAVLATLGAAVVLGAVTLSEISGAPSVPADAWMASVRDETPLHKMVLPGTHDSCARQSAVSVGNGWVIAQALTLDEQLAHGIRYLDMRVGLCQGTSDKLCMYHGDYYLKMNFDDVVGALTTFLTKHPTEALAMRLKVEKSKGIGNFQTLVETSYLNKTPDLWFAHGGKQPTDVLLKDLRGKVLIFWDDGDRTSRFGFTYEAINYRRSWEFKTYDELVQGFRDRAAASSHADVTGWYENPTSGLIYPKGTSIIFKPLLKSIVDTARAVVPLAVEVLKATPMFKGIVSMDFPTDEIIGVLIDSTVTRNRKQ